MRINEMKPISASELTRNLRRVLDRRGGRLRNCDERNHEQIARLVAGLGRQNALDLYRTLPDDVAATWRDFEDIPGLDLVLYQLPTRAST